MTPFKRAEGIKQHLNSQNFKDEDKFALICMKTFGDFILVRLPHPVVSLAWIIFLLSEQIGIQTGCIHHFFLVSFPTYPENLLKCFSIILLKGRQRNKKKKKKKTASGDRNITFCLGKGNNKFCVEMLCLDWITKHVTNIKTVALCT